MLRRDQIPIHNDLRTFISLKYDLRSGVFHIADDVMSASDAASLQHLGIGAHEPKAVTNRSYFYAVGLERLAHECDCRGLVGTALLRMFFVSQPVHRICADTDNPSIRRRLHTVDFR